MNGVGDPVGQALVVLAGASLAVEREAEGPAADLRGRPEPKIYMWDADRQRDVLAALKISMDQDTARLATFRGAVDYLSLGFAAQFTQDCSGRLLFARGVTFELVRAEVLPDLLASLDALHELALNHSTQPPTLVSRPVARPSWLAIELVAHQDWGDLARVPDTMITS